MRGGEGKGSEGKDTSVNKMNEVTNMGRKIVKDVLRKEGKRPRRYGPKNLVPLPTASQTPPPANHADF